MPKYFCDYCGTALTHDSKSVRKSHSLGRNHVKYIVDYYENVGREEGFFRPDMPSSTNPATPASALPTTANPLDQSKQLAEVRTGIPGIDRRQDANSLDRVFAAKPLPPPATIPGLPPPPPQFYHLSTN
uniref:ARAD1B06292p n=1 Tax=Blastobotrys adeninivorans TaxID=409370 RepID=A0A060T5T3_BLAAD